LQRPPRRSAARGARRNRASNPARFLTSRFSIAAVAAALLAACALVGTEERPAPGGIYREALVGQPLSLNPLIHPNDRIARDVGQLVYGSLVRVVDGTSIAGDIARDWVTAPNGLTYTFRLRPDLRWHDAHLVTSADVLATIALLQSPSYTGPREVAEVWRGVRGEAPDPTTVVFHLAQPFAPFIEACSFPILPRHLFGDDGSANLLEHPSSFFPIGSGPYRVRSVDESGLDLVRNDTYPVAHPLLDEIQFRYFENAASAEKAVEDGAVDGFASSARPTMATQNGTAPVLAVHEAPLFGTQMVLFLGGESAIVGDRAVRLAIERGIDRRALVDGPLAWVGVAAYSPVPAYSWAYSPDVERPPDPAQAARLLDDAGWVGGPVRTRAGRELRVELNTMTDEQSQAVGGIIAGQLAPLGFRVIIQPLEALDLYRERLAAHRFDLVLANVSLGSSDPDPSWMWHSSQRGDGLNFAGYASPVADDLMARARADLDPTRRRTELASFQQLWLDDVPSVVLASPLLFYETSSSIRGVRLGTLVDPSARFQHVDEWYVRTQRVPVLGR